MPKNYPIQKGKCFRVNQSVEVTDSIHSHVVCGMVGIIKARILNGYAVLFEHCIHRSNFGGGTEYKRAIVFMTHTHLKPLTVKTSLGFLPKELRKTKLKELLVALTKSDLSLTRAATILFGTTQPYDLARAESALDSLQDEGICVNRGQFEDYKYRVTEKGTHVIEHNLI